MRSLLVIIATLALASCAGFRSNEVVNEGGMPQKASYMIFSFKDPDLDGGEYPDVGNRLTQIFTRVSSQYGYKIVPAPAKQFPSFKDLDLREALDYAQANSIDYIIFGQVTKWIDRTSSFDVRRDYAGLSVTAYDVFAAKTIRNADIDQRSNFFASGSPDDYAESLVERVAEVLFDIEEEEY